MNEKLTEEFEQYLIQDESKRDQLTKTIQWLSVFRLAAFAGILFSLIYLPDPFRFIASIICLGLFFYFVRTFINKQRERELYKRLITINQNEILAINEVYHPFEGGEKFTDTHHSYSYDLDLFGEGSLFQFINRTGTELGEKRLAHFLTNLQFSRKILTQKQEALEELSKNVRWRQLLIARGQKHDEKDFKLLQVLSKYQPLQREKLIKRFIQILPSIAILTLLLSAFTILPWGYFLTSFLINIGVISFFGQTINAYYHNFGSQSKILDNYRNLLKHIEEADFKSDHLKGIQEKLTFQNQKASAIIERLLKIMSRFDYRANIIFIFIADPVFLWDLQCVYKLDRWQREYHDQVNKWFDVIAEFDAISSLANVNHTHPDWSKPEFTNSSFLLSGKNLGHPLIKRLKRVGNDFNMGKKGTINIITGANMAGKSTFLRTIGVNMILAMNGCRVCADSFSLTPVPVYTNMRTTDNLQKDESYFYAELLRLQQMLELLNKETQVFIIIDEMLKGTNSIDKLNGSKALIEKLIALEANGLVATHDLKLTELKEQFPDKIINQCFEVSLVNDNLRFDYKLQDGVTTTMNATYLMKQMGIIG